MMASPTSFQLSWELLKGDLPKAAKDFVRMGKLLKELNMTFNVLVLKMEDPRRLEYFRPISLCNTIYKVLAKVMVNHIKPLLEKFIGPF